MEVVPASFRYSGLLGNRDAARQRRNDQVRALERILLEAPQVDVAVKNLVHGGMCVRWIHAPKGTTISGATTLLDNICIVFGDITVTTDNNVQRLTGFHVLPASAGNKRGGHAHADTWWATVWSTDLTDLAAIEDEMTSESAMLQTRRVGIEWAMRPELAS